MLHPGFIRYFEGALHGLAEAGHEIHVAFEVNRAKLGEDVTAQRLAASSPGITCGTAPTRSESVRSFLARSDRSATRSGGAARSWRDPATRAEAWESLATTVRLLLDYLRYFDPAFAGATALRARAEKRLPRIYRSLARVVSSGGRAPLRMFSAALRAVERVVPPNAAVEAFVREQNPDLLLVTPLIELGSQQVDYVKCARRHGIRSALCVASWDNLTSKGLVRVRPDHVVVWNESQKAEAVALHGIAPAQVSITGAQLFDRWFDGVPSRSRAEFCAMAGLDAGRPYVLYVGSSTFIAPDEVPFAERWLSRLRHAADPRVASLGVLVRPHPANAAQWRAFDTSRPDVAVWPPIGTDPNAPDFHRDYFDSIYYSAAVVGINTSAQIEAGIVGRPVLTVRAPEFVHAQAGTLHFQYLVQADGGFVRPAEGLDEHVAQLAAALDEGPAAEGNRRFVASFVRPLGVDRPAVPVFVDAVSAIAAQPRPRPQRNPLWVRAARGPAFGAAVIARTLAEDRPFWVYLLRPFVTAGIWTAVPFVRARDRWRGDGYLRVKRAHRAVSRGWYEAGRRIRRRVRPIRKPIAAVMRGAARRLVRKDA